MNHLENNRFLDDNQNGFRKNRSRIDAALKFVHDLYSNDNSKLITSAIFMDYKKAFDSISHEILIDKLKGCNISKAALAWLRNYLTGRQQRTMVNGVKSNWKTLFMEYHRDLL